MKITTMKNLKVRSVTIALLVCGAVLLTACGQNQAAQETAAAGMVSTSVAETLTAAPTQTPLPTSTDYPTWTPPPTETPSPLPSQTSSPTLATTEAPAGGASTQISTCDNALFVSDVSIPDGTKFAPGTAFTKTWRVRNTGTCTWNSEYAIVYLSGNAMNGTSPQKIGDKNIKPGESLDISVEMVAPAQTGKYTGYWRLQNTLKEGFGDSFYVQIEVDASIRTATATQAPSLTPTETPTPTETLTLEPSATP